LGESDDRLRIAGNRDYMICAVPSPFTVSSHGIAKAPMFRRACRCSPRNRARVTKGDFHPERARLVVQVFEVDGANDQTNRDGMNTKRRLVHHEKNLPNRAGQ
jgi:hypothetical protein